jgi:hypothetical protein
MAVTDQDMADVVNLARKCGVIIIVKGTDEHPVVIVKAKCIGKPRYLWPSVGGLELKKLIARATT